MNENTTQWVGIDLVFIEQETGQGIHLTIPVDTFFRVYRIINDTGIKPLDAFHLAELGAWVANEGQISKEQENRIIHVIKGMQNIELFPNEHWESTEDALLSFSYRMIRARMATYAQMAELAASSLDRTISTDTWKHRVIRWAKRHNLPKIELRKRRAKENQPEGNATSDKSGVNVTSDTS